MVDQWWRTKFALCYILFSPISQRHQASLILIFLIKNSCDHLICQLFITGQKSLLDICITVFSRDDYASQDSLQLDTE